jgi:hypothetical protein
MQTRGPNHSNALSSAQLTIPVSSVPLQTAMVTTAEAMNIDKSSTLPLSNMMINPSENMNLDNPAMLPLTTQSPTHAQQQLQQNQQSQTHQLIPHDQGHHSSMLQFNHFNISQTQVRVQVTSQPALCPTLEANHNTQLTAALPNLALNNLMMPLTIHNSPQQQSDLLSIPVGRMITPPMQQLQQPSEAQQGQSDIPILPPGQIITPPTQQLQRNTDAQQGHLRQSTVDKGKSVLSHDPPLHPQTLVHHINQPQPWQQPQYPNYSPQQLQAYDNLVALGILDGVSYPDPTVLDHLMECLD